MARKNTLQYKLLAAQSLTASFSSPVTLIKNLDNCSYQINVTTSDSIGNFTVEVSNDYTLDETVNKVTNAGNWVALTLNGGTPNANAANDNIIIDLNQLPFNAMRISYAPSTPGTGTCDIWLSAKQIGA